MSFGSRARSGAALLRRAAPRAALLALLWWVLNNGSTGSWWLAVPTLVGAVLLSLALTPTSGWGWSPLGFIRFVPFFLWQSVGGGVDVALRALRPSLPLAPDFVEYELRLSPQAARVFMADVASLLPGTLGAELKGDRLNVHVLNSGPRALESIEELESRVAALFGVELEAGEGSP